MTDREKLLISLVSNDDERDGGVTVLDVVAMLYELGHEYRTNRARLVLASA